MLRDKWHILFQFFTYSGTSQTPAGKSLVVKTSGFVMLFSITKALSGFSDSRSFSASFTFKVISLLFLQPKTKQERRNSNTAFFIINTCVLFGVQNTNKNNKYVNYERGFSERLLTASGHSKLSTEEIKLFCRSILNYYTY